MVTGQPYQGTDETANTIPDARNTTDASAPGSSATDQSQSTADKVQQKAGQVADQVQEKASEAADKARGAAKSQLRDTKHTAVQQLDTVAGAVSDTGDKLRQQDHDQMAHLADMASSQIQNVASYLRNRNIGDLINDAENFARSQPAIFLAGAFALGLLGARFLKASPESSQGRRMTPYGRNTANYRQQRFGTGSSGNVTGSVVNEDERPWGDEGAPYGVFDPGSRGQYVRDIPQ